MRMDELRFEQKQIVRNKKENRTVITLNGILYGTMVELIIFEIYKVHEI